MIGVSFFVVVVVTAMYVLYENEVSKYPQQSPPPMGNRNRPIGPSTVPGRAHCPSGGGGGMISFSIFVVSGRTCLFIRKSRQTRRAFMLRCGRTRVRIRSARGVLYGNRALKYQQQSPRRGRNSTIFSICCVGGVGLSFI